MKEYLLMSGALALLVFIAGCGTTQEEAGVHATVERSEGIVKETTTATESATAPTATQTGSIPLTAASFSPKGNILAGSTSPYLEFNHEDYEAAFAAEKTVLLYFYANWCPICKAEQQHTFAAFNELDNPDVVGFRVNYKDSETDDAEEQLARQFGITYQHTKVIIKDGSQVLKAPNSWNREKYLAELGKRA